MSRKNWCFTLNNPTLAEDLNLRVEKPEVRYLIFQEENVTTRHYQGYIQFRERVRLSTAKQFVGVRAHLEGARGTSEENIAYCSKIETRLSGPFSYGTPECQGNRRDLQVFNDAIRLGKSDIELIEEHIVQFYKHAKIIDRVRLAYQPKRNWLMDNIVYWGPSGTGKTRRAYDEGGTSVYFVSKGDSNQSTWWDGYGGEHTVVLDDFYGWLPWSFMLRLLDRYPFTVQFKGGSRQFTSKRIIITSNHHPNQWYKTVPNNDMTPLLRRLNKIENLS